MQYTAYRTKLKLNNYQATLCRKHAGFSRWVYNWGLRLWSEGYKDGLKPSANTLKKLFINHVKPLFPWMSELSSKVYQYAFISLGEAFKRFFKKLGGYPRFKKKGLHDRFTIDNSGTPIKIGGVRHKLPFIGWVRTHEAMPECATKKVTISRQAGEWYLSFHVEVPELEPTPHQRETIGVDLGINALATCSDGTVFANPKAYRKANKRLGRLQQELSRKVKGSANWHKAVLKVAKLHRTVANIRKDAIHKITTFLAKNHSQVVIEDLNVAGMLKNHSLAGSIADASFGEFRRQLEYKTQRYSSFLVIADRFFPSSQLCSECRHQQKMPLGSRTFECEKCGSVKDRDFNASVNLEHYPTAVGLTVDACGAGAADSPC